MRDQQTDVHKVSVRLWRAAEAIMAQSAWGRCEAIAIMEEFAALCAEAAQNDRALRDIGFARGCIKAVQASVTAESAQNELHFALGYLVSAYDKHEQTQPGALHPELAGTDNHRRKERTDAGGTTDHETDAG